MIHSPRTPASSLSPATKGLFWIVLASVAIMIPTLIWGVPSSQDLTNHFRFALPFYDSLRAGDFFPGWLAESNAGFGDASFRFYPPALYYLLAFARTVTTNWFAGTLLTATLLSAVGALGVYFWARAISSAPIAVWAGVIYTVAPYHLNQLFQSFMLAEFAGAAVLPFAFAFVERICQRRRLRDVAGLAASYAVLILTHLPLAVIGSIALVVYAIFRLSTGKRLATLACLALSAAIGLAASASYWMTVLSELKWIRADNINPDPSVDYRKNFVLSSFSPDYLNVWWMNIVLLATVMMFWPALTLLWRSTRNSARDYPIKPPALVALGAVLLLTIVMATPISRPIWNLLRPLQATQFPWRWLAITSMVCPVLLASAIPFWRKISSGRKRPLAMLAAGAVAIAFAFSAAHIIRGAHWLTPRQFEERLNEIPGSQSVTQWLPVWVHEPVPSMNSPVEATDRQIAIESWAPERRVFRVGAGRPGDARVRTFYYPHWAAIADGQPLPIHPDGDGVLSITLPANATSVTLEFREPARVRYAAALTIVGWVATGLLLFRRRYSLPVA